MDKPEFILNADRVVAEFVADVEAAGVESVRADWPDLYVTYTKALVVLAGLEIARREAKP